MYDKIFVVLDTSFLIENVHTLLGLFEYLKAMALDRMKVVVPFVVIHELDTMKVPPN
jgi:rRNA-processing protein FCF1